MSPHGFALFDTPIGTCGLSWNAAGVTGLQLPESSAEATRVRIRRRWPSAAEVVPPPPEMQRVLLRGGTAEADTLADIPLDLTSVPDFHRRVYEVARTIPPGHTMTYGEIAKRLDAPHESREVGQALGRNPVAIIVPCHRVLGADGKMGGFSANGGVATKRRILEIEGADAVGAGPLFGSLSGRGG